MQSYWTKALGGQSKVGIHVGKRGSPAIVSIYWYILMDTKINDCILCMYVCFQVLMSSYSYIHSSIPCPLRELGNDDNPKANGFQIPFSTKRNQEDPICCRATKSMSHNCWTCALEAGGHNCWSPHACKLGLCNKRSHCNKKPMQQQTPSTGGKKNLAVIIIFFFLLLMVCYKPGYLLSARDAVAGKKISVSCYLMFLGWQGK